MKNNPNKTITRDFGKKDRHVWLQQYRSLKEDKQEERYSKKKHGSPRSRWVLTSLMMAGALAVSVIPKHLGATEVQVFTTSQIPVVNTSLPGVTVEVYELDQLSNNLQALNKQLQSLGSVTPEQAGILFNGALPDLKDSFQGLTLANQYGITQLPTMVLDQGKAETVGITSVGQAVAQYQSWRATQ